MKRIFSAILATTLIFPGVIAKAYQNCSDWAKQELAKAEQMQIIPNSLNDSDLTKDITREEFSGVSVKLYESLSGKKAVIEGDNPFCDTFSEDVMKAYSLGITLGTSKTEFSPNKLLSREEATVMLTRVYKKCYYSDWNIKNDNEFKLSFEAGEKFADDDLISDWARDSVYFMVSKNVVKGIGNNKFAPKNITEEEKLAGYANISAESAIVMAERLIDAQSSEKEKEDEEFNPDPYSDVHEEAQKSKDENTYTVAFIGGSLTEGGAFWITETKKAIQAQMPEKTVVTINAGKGGTCSDYGAARFYEDVGQFEPDAVFIEFAVNDYYMNETDAKMYMESIVRQCLKLKKIPAVCFLYAPEPWEKTTESYQTWLRDVNWKEEVAKHYGIKSINIYDYMQSDYEAQKEEKGFKTFTDYLQTMYSGTAPSFDVHGGYQKYAEIITQEIEKDIDGVLTIPKKANVYCSANKKIVEARYSQIYIDDAKMHYSGTWDIYSKSRKFSSNVSCETIPDKQYSYPYFSHGIRQVLNESSAFGFMSKASAFCLNYIASSSGSAATVYIDGVEKGKLSCDSIYHGMNYTTSWIELPNDGREHKVILIVNEPNSGKYVFRFGSVIERYN